MSATPALCSLRSFDRGCRFRSRPAAIPPLATFAVAICNGSFTSTPAVQPKTFYVEALATIMRAI